MLYNNIKININKLLSQKQNTDLMYIAIQFITNIILYILFINAILDIMIKYIHLYLNNQLT